MAAENRRAGRFYSPVRFLAGADRTIFLIYFIYHFTSDKEGRELVSTISGFGLGYVGCVLAACLAEHGHEVIGVDVNPMKVEMVNRGESPVIEAGLGELIHKNVNASMLKATQDGEWAILN